MTGAIYPDLKGKTVFITGGAMGIGEAFVEEFAKQGAKTAFVDVVKEAGEKLKARLPGEYPPKKQAILEIGDTHSDLVR